MDLATATYEVEPIPHPTSMLKFRVVEVLPDGWRFIMPHSLRRTREEAEAKAEAYRNCRACVTSDKDGGPSHNGSRHCESGSIASGGKRAHCACELCW